MRVAGRWSAVRCAPRWRGVRGVRASSATGARVGLTVVAVPLLLTVTVLTAADAGAWLRGRATRHAVVAARRGTGSPVGRSAMPRSAGTGPQPAMRDRGRPRCLAVDRPQPPDPAHAARHDPVPAAGRSPPVRPTPGGSAHRQPGRPQQPRAPPPRRSLWPASGVPPSRSAHRPPQGRLAARPPAPSAPASPGAPTRARVPADGDDRRASSPGSSPALVALMYAGVLVVLLAAEDEIVDACT